MLGNPPTLYNMYPKYLQFTEGGKTELSHEDKVAFVQAMFGINFMPESNVTQSLAGNPLIEDYMNEHREEVREGTQITEEDVDDFIGVSFDKNSEKRVSTDKSSTKASAEEERKESA